MSRVATKRKRPKKWLLAFYRPLGEFVDGERRMTNPDKYSTKEFRNRKLAMKSQARGYRDPFRAFIYEKGRKPKRIIEIQIWPENYPAE